MQGYAYIIDSLRNSIKKSCNGLKETKNDYKIPKTVQDGYGLH